MSNVLVIRILVKYTSIMIKCSTEKPANGFESHGLSSILLYNKSFRVWHWKDILEKTVVWRS